MAVGGEVEGFVEFCLLVGVVGCCGFEALLDAGEGRGDAVLFLFEEIDGDRSGVVGLEELVTLREEFALLLDEVLAFEAGLRGQNAELFRDGGSERFD